MDPITLNKQTDNFSITLFNKELDEVINEYIDECYIENLEFNGNIKISCKKCKDLIYNILFKHTKTYNFVNLILVDTPDITYKLHTAVLYRVEVDHSTNNMVLNFNYDYRTDSIK